MVKIGEPLASEDRDLVEVVLPFGRLLCETVTVALLRKPTSLQHPAYTTPHTSSGAVRYNRFLNLVFKCQENTCRGLGLKSCDL